MTPRHVYIHVPFCGRRCAYCDFAIAVRRDVPADQYLSSLAREMSIRFPSGDAWIVDTLYLGGGTPSRLGGAGIARLVDLVRLRLTLAPDAEVTVEANPEDVTRESARTWRSHGVNRLSIGSQSFDDRVLQWMHRTHTAHQIGRAVAAARDAGIDNLSLDLIFAVPAVLGRDWRLDLDRALALAPDHLSLYGLTVEQHTPLAGWRDRGQVLEAPEEQFEEQFLLAHDVLGAEGFRHYEVSNYARLGRESRHNSSYWRGLPYAGLGPSAHEFDGSRRRWNVASYVEWVRRLAAAQDPVSGHEELTNAERATERVYLGLRTARGLELDDDMAELARPWVSAGWATLGDDHLRLTPTGWMRLDAIAASLTAATSRSYI